MNFWGFFFLFFLFLVWLHKPQVSPLPPLFWSSNKRRCIHTWDCCATKVLIALGSTHYLSCLYLCFWGQIYGLCSLLMVWQRFIKWDSCGTQGWWLPNQPQIHTMILLFFGGFGGCTQGFVLARQILHHLSHTARLFCLRLVFRKGLKFYQELVSSSLYLLSGRDNRHVPSCSACLLRRGSC